MKTPNLCFKRIKCSNHIYIHVEHIEMSAIELRINKDKQTNIRPNMASKLAAKIKLNRKLIQF